jgi:hypothetical protein
MGINCYLHAVDADAVDRLLADPAEAGPVLRQGSPACDLHKAWHVIHYILTGTADGGTEPHCFLLQGGVELGAEDLDDGYGPPRLLRPDEVRAFNDVLQPIGTPDALRERFDHRRMVAAGIYSLNDEDEAEDLEFTAHYLGGLRSFIEGAAAAGQGVLVSMG